MSDLHERLTAAVTARLRVARAATPGPWEREWAVSTHFVVPEAIETYSAVVDGNVARLRPEQRADADFIAANDPATAIRHCERDLRVLTRHTPFEQRNWSLARGSFTEPGCEHCELTSNDGEALARDWPCDDIRDLATAYAVEVVE